MKHFSSSEAEGAYRITEHSRCKTFWLSVYAVYGGQLPERSEVAVAGLFRGKCRR